MSLLINGRACVLAWRPHLSVHCRFLGVSYRLGRVDHRGSTRPSVTAARAPELRPLPAHFRRGRGARHATRARRGEGRPQPDQYSTDSRSVEERKIYKLAETRLDILLRECRSNNTQTHPLSMTRSFICFKQKRQLEYCFSPFSYLHGSARAKEKSNTAKFGISFEY
jgi:hypothetical protein